MVDGKWDETRLRLRLRQVLGVSSVCLCVIQIQARCGAMTVEILDRIGIAAKIVNKCHEGESK